MAGTITIETNEKVCHDYFIAWLNALLGDYKSSFYDEAVSNIIKVSFIKTHYSYLQELFQSDGKTLACFMTVLPTDTTNPILMVHSLGSGVPTLYDKDDNANLFEFDSEGKLIRFFENVTVTLKDVNDNDFAECYVVFEDLFGIKCPMIYIKEIGTNALIGKGLVDVDYEDRYSGSYMVKNAPLDELPKFSVTNITKAVITADIPILTDLNLRYEIKSGHTIFIPVTEWTEYYFKQGKDLDALKVKKV